MSSIDGVWNAWLASARQGAMPLPSRSRQAFLCDISRYLVDAAFTLQRADAENELVEIEVRPTEGSLDVAAARRRILTVFQRAQYLALAATRVEEVPSGVVGRLLTLLHDADVTGAVFFVEVEVHVRFS